MESWLLRSLFSHSVSPLLSMPTITPCRHPLLTVCGTKLESATTAAPIPYPTTFRLAELGHMQIS